MCISISVPRAKVHKPLASGATTRTTTQDLLLSTKQNHKLYLFTNCYGHSCLPASDGNDGPQITRNWKTHTKFLVVCRPRRRGVDAEACYLHVAQGNSRQAEISNLLRSRPVNLAQRSGTTLALAFRPVASHLGHSCLPANDGNDGPQINRIWCYSNP